MRVRLDLGYDGTAFAGWARQPGLRTVQEELEGALERVLRLPAPPAVVVAGRTDAGVHARGQVVHADLPAAAWAAAPGRSARAPGDALVSRLAGVLPPDVVVRRAAPAPPGFDARFAALRRRYAYRVSDVPGGPDPLRRRDVVDARRAGVRPSGPLDVAAMDAASAALEGLHDFAAYCRPREGATTTRTLLRYRWRRAGEGDPAGEAGLLVAEVVADAFCHSMVRALVGAALAVGAGRRPTAWPAEVLARAVRDPGVTVAPAHGLVLEAVDYPDDAGLAVRVRQARARRDAPAGVPAATPGPARGSLGPMSTPASPDQDPVTSLADTEDDAYASERLDEGISPNDREVRVGRFGMTADEELAGESLDERLAEEEPDPSASLVLDGSDEEDRSRPAGDRSAADDDAVSSDLPADQPAGGTDGELLDDEVGDARAGRLVEPDQGASTDREKSAVATDAGIDGGSASAEEAAVHVVPDVEDDDRS